MKTWNQQGFLQRSAANRHWAAPEAERQMLLRGLFAVVKITNPSRGEWTLVLVNFLYTNCFTTKEAG